MAETYPSDEELINISIDSATMDIEFKLIENGKIVGYERHILCCGTMCIQHRRTEEEIWRFIYPDYKHWISHNQKLLLGVE